MRTSCGQGPQISGLVISHAVLPATKHDANPFEGQGSHYGMVVLTTLALLLVIGTRPNRLRNRVSCPFVKTLPQKLGTRPAKVHPFLLSTALRHGRNPAVLLHLFGTGITIALRPQCGQQARRQRCPAASASIQITSFSNRCRELIFR